MGAKKEIAKRALKSMGHGAGARDARVIIGRNIPGRPGFNPTKTSYQRAVSQGEAAKEAVSKGELKLAKDAKINGSQQYKSAGEVGPFSKMGDAKKVGPKQAKANKSAKSAAKKGDNYLSGKSATESYVERTKDKSIKPIKATKKLLGKTAVGSSIRGQHAVHNAKKLVKNAATDEAKNAAAQRLTKAKSLRNKALDKVKRRATTAAVIGGSTAAIVSNRRKNKKIEELTQQLNEAKKKPNTPQNQNPPSQQTPAPTPAPSEKKPETSNGGGSSSSGSGSRSGGSRSGGSSSGGVRVRPSSGSYNGVHSGSSIGGPGRGSSSRRSHEVVREKESGKTERYGIKQREKTKRTEIRAERSKERQKQRTARQNNRQTNKSARQEKRQDRRANRRNKKS